MTSKTKHRKPPEMTTTHHGILVILKGIIGNTFALAVQSFPFCFSDFLSNDFHVVSFAFLKSSAMSCHCKYDFMKFSLFAIDPFFVFLLFFCIHCKKLQAYHLFTR